MHWDTFKMMHRCLINLLLETSRGALGYIQNDAQVFD